MGTFITEYWHIGVVGACLLALVIDFVRRFLLESQRLKRELRNAIEELRSISGQMNGEWVDLHAVKTKAMQSPSLSHLWAEYAKTLHAQLGEEDELGQRKIMRWRATSLAEAFFTDQAIVDNRLKTDFFKHLPGVLTGLGITGTFAGLIQISSSDFLVKHNNDVINRNQARLQLFIVDGRCHGLIVSNTILTDIVDSTMRFNTHTHTQMTLWSLDSIGRDQRDRIARIRTALEATSS